ncbi:MAG: DUF1365 domain-containing protein [Chloroflexota bacterium]
MNSHLLEGKVRHQRSRPFKYGLEHDVFYAALDLDELNRVDRSLRLLGRNRRSLLAIRDADHLPAPSTDLPSDIRAHLREHGHDAAGWRITLVTNLRFLGHVFNPASFFLCRDADDVLRVVIIEVHNTYGERHLYTLGPQAEDGPFRSAMDKDFYVSPFIEPDGRYAVFVQEDATGLRIAINEQQDDRPLLSTSLVLARRPLTDRWLLRMLFRHPFVTRKTIAMIHWHAIRLWLRGAKYFPHQGRHPSPTREAIG